MEIKASLKHQRIAPRKIRLAADLIRGKNVEEAKKSMMFLKKGSAEPVLKLLNSALSNAKNNSGAKEEELGDFYIKEIIVNEGPKLKRWRPVSRGSAHEIQKKTSHVLLVLGKKEPKQEAKEKEKKQKKEKPKKNARIKKTSKSSKNKKNK